MNVNAPPLAAEAPPSGGVPVLLVEDDPTSAELVRLILRSDPITPFRVEWVETLAAALERLGRDNLAAVLLDLGLPDSQGLATLEQLRARFPHVPVVVLTGHADEQLALQTLQQGAQDYLIKGQGDAATLRRALRYAIERAAVEQTLAYERDLFNTLMQNVPDHIYFKDRQSRFIRISQAQARKFGLRSPEDAVHKTDFDMFTPEHAAPAFADEQEVMRTGQTLLNKVEKETMPDGTVTWALTTKLPLRDAQGQIIGTFGVSKDITALRAMEEKFAAEHHRLRSLLDALPDEIYVKDTASRFVVANRSVAKFFGLDSIDELIGKTDFDLLPQQLAQQFFDEERALLRSGGTVVDREAQLTDQQGGKRWVLTTKVPLRDAAGAVIGLVGSNRDISALKHSEEQLQLLNADLGRSQRELLQVLQDLQQSHEDLKAAQAHLIQAAKMESVGRLAAGVAHEVKNPLAIILMGVSYLTENLPNPGEDAKMILQEMHEAVERADTIIRELLDYSAPSGLELSEENLCAVVQRALMLVRHLLSQNRVRLITHLHDQVPLLRLDPVKIEQVFINLFINAIHAMPEGGTLTVAVNGAPGSDGHPAVVVTVDDTGKGIQEENLQKIFEPFFTTKAAGVGTGLGLAMARTIVESHHGTIRIANRPEGGVRATLTFAT